MTLSELSGLFSLTTCSCGEEHYLNEPCPRCTAGDYHALEARLAAALAREQFLMRTLGVGVKEGEIPNAPAA